MTDRNNKSPHYNPGPYTGLQSNPDPYAQGLRNNPDPYAQGQRSFPDPYAQSARGISDPYAQGHHGVPDAYAQGQRSVTGPYSQGQRSYHDNGRYSTGNNHHGYRSPRSTPHTPRTVLSPAVSKKSEPQTPKRSPHCHTCKRSDGSHSKSCNRHTHHHKHHHHHKTTTSETSIGTGPSLIDTIILAILAISSLIFVVIGIWLLASSLGWPVGLDFTGNHDWTRTISFGDLTLITGLVLIILIIVAALDLTMRPRSPRLTTVFISAICFMLLLTMTIIAIIFAAGSTAFTNGTVQSGWKNSARTDTQRLCSYQDNHQCLGFNNGDCDGCNAGNNFSTCSELCPRCADQGTARMLLSPRSPVALSSWTGHISSVHREEDNAASPGQGMKVRVLARLWMLAVASMNSLQDQLWGTRVSAISPNNPEQARLPSAAQKLISSASAAVRTQGSWNGESGGGGGVFVPVPAPAANNSSNNNNGPVATPTGGGGGVAVPVTAVASTTIPTVTYTNSGKPGCRQHILNDYRSFFVPFGIFTLFLAILTLLEFFFICCVLVRK